jgi:Family of unknown function (DUF6279)
VKWICTFLLLLWLSGCSTVRLVYDNADTYLRWRASHYLDLDAEMTDELEERIAAFMAWHRLQALPKYAQLLDEAGQRFERHLTPADLVWGYDSVMTQARESLRMAAVQGAPLLDRLNAKQIANLERKLADDNRRFARENLRGDERERRKRRTERTAERVEDWVGRLTKAQLERVAQYAERAPLLDEFRDRDHKRIQGEFLAIVRAREAKKRLPEFAVNWDRGRDPAYLAALEAARKEFSAMLLDLERSLSPQQRTRAAGELHRYAEDFRILSSAHP